MLVFPSDYLWLAGIIIAGFSLYKGYLEGPNIQVNPGDSIDIIKLPDCTAKNIHVACTFINKSKKSGFVKKVDILLTKKEANQKYLFKWYLFYKYRDGQNAYPDSKVLPISVPGNDNTLQGIEFKPTGEVDWQEGEYKLRLIAWIEGSFFKKGYIDKQFSIFLNQQFIKDLKKLESLPNPQLRTVMIEERELIKETT